MRKDMYFRLQLKRTFKMYPSILLITLLTVVGIALTGALLLWQYQNSDDMKKVSIGVVGDIEDPYIQMGMGALKNMDNSRFYVEFIEMPNEEEAVKALKKRKISGYVDIPLKYVEDVYYGENTPARYVMINEPDNIGSVLTTEIVDVVSNLVTETQKAAYTMRNVATVSGHKENLNTNIDTLNMDFLSMVLNRKDVYDLEVMGISDTLSMGGYYICGIFLFFILLWGISCNRLLTSKNIALARHLNASGLSSARQLFCEYISFLSVTMLTMLILAAIFGAVVQNNSFGIAELETSGIVSCIGFVIKALPVIMMIAAMQLAFYEIVPNVIGSVLVQFLLAVGLGYISGCFYPNYAFPDSVQSFVGALPTGVGFSYLRKIMSDTVTASDFVLPLIYIIGFSVLTWAIRNRRLAGDGR